MYKVIALLGLAAFGTAIPISYIQDEIDELKHEVDALKKHDVRHGLRLERRNGVRDTIKDDLKEVLHYSDATAGFLADKFMTELRAGGNKAKAASSMLEELIQIKHRHQAEEDLMAALKDAGFVDE